MASAGYSVTISAVDKASGVIGKVNSGLATINRNVSGYTASFGRFGREMQRLSDNTGVTKLTAGVADLGRRAVRTADSLGRFAPALASITSIASLGGIAALATQFAQFGSALGFAAQRANLGVTQLHGLQGAAMLAGSSADALTSGMTALGDNLVNAVAGRAPQVAALMSQLGISFVNSATGGERLAEDVLPEIADKIASIHSPTRQAIIATQMFGAAGENLLPFLRRGRAGIAEYNTVAARYGLLNQHGVDAANDLRVAQTKLELSFRGLGYTIAEHVAPILTPMLTRFADWIAAHREDVGRFFERVAHWLEKWATPENLDHLITKLGEFATTTNGFVQNIGGWGKAIEVFAGIWIGTKVLGMLAGLGRLASLLSLVGGTSPPAWLLAIMGAGGAAAGAMNVPMVDDLGRPVGNWGGAEGERNAAAASRPRRALGAWEYGGEGLPAASANPSSQEREERLRIGRNILMGLGRTSQQAAGIMAGLLDESGLNPTAVGDSGQAYGLAQLHPARRRAVETHFGRSMVGMSFEDQIRAVDWEMRNGERAAGDRIAGSTTAAETGYNMRYYYERPLNREGDSQHTAAVAAALGRRWENDPPHMMVPSPDATPARRQTPVDIFHLPMHDDPTTWPSAPAAPVVPTAPPPGAVGAAGTEGKSTVRLMFDNPPPGLRVSTVNSDGGMRIETPSFVRAP